MKTRTDLLNHLIQKRGLKRYLEIGLQDSTQNFDKIQAQYKVSVDPDPNAHASFCMTSDDFFMTWTQIEVTCKDNNGQRTFIDPGHHYVELFDLIFIDGLHTAEQVKKDFENALEILSPNGFIVLHDCNPEKEEHTIVPRPTERGHWNGDVYKFATILASNWLSYKTVDIDNGCGVYCKNTADVNIHYAYPLWDYFNNNRKELLNLISWDEFIGIGSHV